MLWIWPSLDRFRVNIAMAHKNSSSRKNEPERATFAIYLGAAPRMIKNGELPAWFDSHFGGGELDRIACDYGLPREALLNLAAALHFSLAKPLFDPPVGRVDRKHKSARLHLEKARALLPDLSHLPSMQPECREITEMPDGLVEAAIRDPVEECVRDLDRILQRLRPARRDVGNRNSYAYYAVLALDRLIERHNRTLSRASRETLCHELLDRVRQNHGHLSRSPDRDDREPPRFGDLLDRVAKERLQRQTPIIGTKNA
jgi:hypothetical protein